MTSEKTGAGQDSMGRENQSQNDKIQTANMTKKYNQAVHNQISKHHTYFLRRPPGTI